MRQAEPKEGFVGMVYNRPERTWNGAIRTEKEDYRRAKGKAMAKTSESQLNGICGLKYSRRSGSTLDRE